MTPLPPLTPSVWLSSWSVDVPVLVLCAAALLGYVGLTRRHTDWPKLRVALFAAGLVIVAVLTSSFLGTYSHRLVWVLAAQDVLLLTTAPTLLVLARPDELLRPAPRRSMARQRTSPGLRRSIPALVGSLLAVGVLLAIYETQWDLERLKHRGLFLITQVLLVMVGFVFLGSLLDDRGGSYGMRMVVVLLDGLLDALPGLAVLGTHSLSAAPYYLAHARSWGPTLSQDQQTAAMTMIALSEIVGLPALLLLLVRWVRADALEALTIDACLDAPTVSTTGNAAATADGTHQPWWLDNAGPLTERIRRERW